MIIINIKVKKEAEKINLIMSFIQIARFLQTLSAKIARESSLLRKLLSRTLKVLFYGNSWESFFDLNCDISTLKKMFYK